MPSQTKPVFLYMYPQEDVFSFEIQNHAWSYDFPQNPEFQMEFDARFRDLVDKTNDSYERKRLEEEYCFEAAKLFRPIYSRLLNQSIDLRYRKKGFRIFYALLDDKTVSSVIDLAPTDNVIYVGMDEKTHTTKVNGHYPYPDNDFIIGQLGNVRRLVVSGFHLHSCVKKVARRAHLRGINTLVDEELTQLFGWNIKKEEFDPRKFPSISPFTNIRDSLQLDDFFHRRRNKPWLYNWQSV